MDAKESKSLQIFANSSQKAGKNRPEWQRPEPKPGLFFNDCRQAARHGDEHLGQDERTASPDTVPSLAG
jgi:hypothetical protein